MTAPAPIDPDLLRTKLTQAVEPLAASPDALRRIRAGVRRRRVRRSFGTGAGALLVTAGAAATVVALGSTGSPKASQATIVPGQTHTRSPATTSAAAPTPVPVVTTDVATAGPTTAVGPVSTTATGTTVPVVPGTTQTSTTPVSTTTPPPVADDVDGDGKADTATTSFSGTSKARLVVHLASGSTLTSATFPLVKGLGAGAVSLADVNGDGRAELLVKWPGADGSGVLLFVYAAGTVVEVPAPAGASQPFLYTGGGGSIRLSFACAAGELIVSKAAPTSIADFVSGKDKSFTFATSTFRLKGGALVKVAGHVQAHLTMAAGLAMGDAAPANRCGAPM